MPDTIQGNTARQVLGTGAATSTAIPDGDGVFVLPKLGWLVSFDVVSEATSQAPVAAHVGVRVNGNDHAPIEAKWIRGNSVFMARDGLYWTGRLPLWSTEDNFIQFALRNDTGSDFAWIATWIVEVP